MLNALRQGKERRDLAGRLYAALVKRAREPVFFERFGVADTVDGRFDLLVLHAWLVLDRVGTAGLSQALIDTIFVGFEEGLRELGAGDIGMGKRVKKLAGAFYGRLEAYRHADGEAPLAEALARNLYRGRQQDQAVGLAAYVSSAKATLADCNVEAGIVDFGPLPG